MAVPKDPGTEGRVYHSQAVAGGPAISLEDAEGETAAVHLDGVVARREEGGGKAEAQGLPFVEPQTVAAPDLPPLRIPQDGAVGRPPRRIPPSRGF